MDELQRLIARIVRGAWRRRWFGIGIAWMICLAGWFVVMRMPDKYESSAQLYVAADPVLTPLLRGIAIGNDSQAEFHLLRRTLLSKPNLQRLIQKTGLSDDVSGPGATEQLIKRLRSQIHVEAQSGNLFSVRYVNTSPQQAFKVVQALVNLYVERATAHNQGDISNAKTFLDSQIKYFHDQLKKLENRRAAFESKYLQLLPGSNGVSAYETERSQLHHLKGALEDEEARKAMIMSELGHTKPVVSAAEAGGHGDAELLAAEAKLAQMKEIYTDAFPGVIEQEKHVAALKRAASGNAPSSSGSGAAVANPVYEQLHMQLLKSNSKIFSLRRKISNSEESVKKLKAVARAQPHLKAIYVNMNRNYGALNKEYQDLIQRREAMRIGAAANIDANQVQLQVVNPPSVPHLPIGPKRLIFLAGVLIVGLGGGAATAVLLSELDGCFDTTEDLRRLGVPVLGVITEAGRRVRPVRALSTFVLAVAPLGAIFVVLVAGTLLHPGML